MEENRPGAGGVRGLMAQFDWRFWRRIFLAFLLLTVIVILVGSTVPLSGQELADIQKNLENTLPKSPDTFFIFRNNFGIASLMFVPILGPIAGVIVLFDTGLAISSLAQPSNLPGFLIFLGLLILPFSWLEFVSYSAAMTQSILLTFRLIRRQGVRNELIRTGIIWAAVLVVLLTSAFIETLFIPR